ncbi:2977_t:CDS:2, partial [Gigaspora margarita]
GKVLKDDKGKVFVLEYSGGKEKRIREGKVVGKEKAQKIKNCCQKKGGFVGEEKVIEKSEGYWVKGSLLGEGRVVRRREGYQKVYYQRGCNCRESNYLKISHSP